MARRILSVIKTETPYQINRNLVPIAIDRTIKNNLLNKLNHTRKIDYKPPWWFHKMKPHLKVGSYFIYCFANSSGALGLTIIPMLVAVQADHI
jgi:hypothetical protein